jgi:hypothetical protein
VRWLSCDEAAHGARLGCLHFASMLIVRDAGSFKFLGRLRFKKSEFAANLTYNAHLAEANPTGTF